MSDVPVVCYFGVDPGCGIDVGPLPPLPAPVLTSPPLPGSGFRAPPPATGRGPGGPGAPVRQRLPPGGATSGGLPPPRKGGPVGPSTFPPAAPPRTGGVPAPVDEVIPPFSLEDPAAASLAKQLAWQDLAATVTRVLGSVFDFVTLATYAADLGPSAAQEAAIVQQTISSSEPNPYYNPDYSPDPYAEPPIFPLIGPFATPDTTGLPQPAIEPAMQPLVVTGTRLGPLTTPFSVPGVAAVPGTLQYPGLFSAPGVLSPPRTSTRVGPSPVTSGFGRVVAPLGPVPELLTDPLLMPLVGPAVTAPTADIPAGGQPASASDCQPSKSDKKQKKKRPKRTICHKGTYYERANGLLKFKQEQIPCR